MLCADGELGNDARFEGTMAINRWRGLSVVNSVLYAHPYTSDQVLVYDPHHTDADDETQVIDNYIDVKINFYKKVSTSENICFSKMV